MIIGPARRRKRRRDHYGMSPLERGMKSFIADFAKRRPKNRTALRASSSPQNLDSRRRAGLLN